MAAIITLLSLSNSLLAYISDRRYARQVTDTKINPPPLFVLGHWRTGTTLLHELLVKDDRFSFPTTFQCMTPHHFLWSDRWLSSRLDWLMPSRRPMDDMAIGMNRPQEDEFALVNLGLGSPYLEWAFPNRRQCYDAYLTLHSLSDDERANWKSQFERFVKQLYLLNPKRVVLKSPTHTARIRTLLEIFPDARFVHIVRNPLQSIPSTVRTWTRVCDAISLQVRREPVTVDRILDVFEVMYHRFDSDCGLIPPDRIVEIRYEDLVANPLPQLQGIYSSLGLDDFEYAQPAISTYLASTANYKPNNLQITDDVKEKIRTRCGKYMSKYGYQP